MQCTHRPFTVAGTVTLQLNASTNVADQHRLDGSLYTQMWVANPTLRPENLHLRVQHQVAIPGIAS